MDIVEEETERTKDFCIPSYRNIIATRFLRMNKRNYNSRDDRLYIFVENDNVSPRSPSMSK